MQGKNVSGAQKEKVQRYDCCKNSDLREAFIQCGLQFSVEPLGTSIHEVDGARGSEIHHFPANVTDDGYVNVEGNLLGQNLFVPMSVCIAVQAQLLACGRNRLGPTACNQSTSAAEDPTARVSAVDNLKNAPAKISNLECTCNRAEKPVPTAASECAMA